VSSRAFVCLALVLFALHADDARGRPQKGDGPTAIAAAFGSLWVGRGDGTVLRFDAGTGKLQARFGGDGFVHAIAPGFGAIWVLGDRVLRIDPRSNRGRILRGTGSATTFELVTGAGSIWVADDGREVVDRIDPRASRRTTTVHVPGRVHGLAAGAGQILVVSVPARRITGLVGPRLIHRIEPASNRVSAPVLRLECDPGLQITRGAVWTTDQCAGTLVRRDPRTLAPTGRVRVGRWRTPLAAFGSIWLHAGVVGVEHITRIDPRDLRVRARIRARAVTITAGAGALWILEQIDGRTGVVRRVDPRTNRVVRTVRVGSG
jgi:streptogramin lyase